MLGRIGQFLAGIGLFVAFSAFPISALVNGDEIWTKAGQVIGNKLIAYGGLAALGGGFLFFIGTFFDD